MEFNLTFVMIKCLFLCVLISGASTRGVPAADDNDEILNRQNENVKSGDLSDLTNCKGCHKSRNDEDSLSSREENRGGNSERTLPQQKPPSFIKPSLSFRGFKIRVNDRRRHDPISRLNRKHRTEQNKLSTTEKVPTDITHVLNKALTTERTPRDSRKNGPKHKSDENNSDKTPESSVHLKASSLKASVDLNKAHKNDKTTEPSDHLKPSSLKVTKTPKEKLEINKKDDDVVNAKNTGRKGKVFGKSEDATNQDKKADAFLNSDAEQEADKSSIGKHIKLVDKEADDILDIDAEQNTETSSIRKDVKFVDKATTPLTKVVKETLEADLFIGKNVKTVKTASDKTDKAKPVNTDKEVSESEAKFKVKPKSEINTDLIQKNEQDTTIENYAKDSFKIRPKTRRLKVDRFVRPDLPQIPDAARLEWRLHPSVDVPVRDILQSIRNMVGYMQRSVQQVNIDFDSVRNTTRWKYMIGVRGGLNTLAEESEVIYTVVLETSLLTKEIYRKAHEHRHPRHSKTDMHSFVADYRQRYRDNVHMELRNEQRAVYLEIEKAKKLVERMKERLKLRQSLKDEVVRVNHLVRDGLAVTALHDLERRAKQTIHVLTVSHPIKNITDRANLYVYMGRDIDATIRNTKAMLIDGYDIITRTRSIVMANQEKVHQYERIVQNTLRSPGTVSKIDRIVAWDRATSYARNLSDTAAFTMMKLKPLIQKADDIMSGKSKYSIEKRLDTSVNHLKEKNEKLKLVYDRIVVAIGDERVVKQRCEMFEGSGWFDDDEDGVADVLIDCEPYITVIESSGDDLEGSGDADGLHIPVDVFLPDGDVAVHYTTDDGDDKMDIDISKIEIIPNTDDVIFIDDNEETLEVVPVTDMPTVEPKTMKSTTSSPHPKTTSKSLKSKPTTLPPKATTPSSVKSSIKATTTPPPPTPTTTTAVSAWFGRWFDDEPSDGNINIDLEAGEDLLLVDNLLNTLIRQRLSNYSIESKSLMERSLEAAGRQNEISQTWLKVQNRFQKFENATRKSLAFVSKWKAEKQVFLAVHDETQAANQNVALKADMVQKQSEAAVKKAKQKLKSKKKILETQKEKEKSAADPVEFQQAKEKVTMATENIKEIQRLKQLYPNPCSGLQLIDNSIKSNITELRKKIAKAKLLASSLKLAISVQKDKPMIYDIPQQHLDTDPLRSNIRMMLQHSGSDGHVITLNNKDEETISLKMNENKLEVVQYIDGDEEVLTVPDSNNITDKQYLLEIERYGTVYNFTLTTSDGEQIKVGTKSLFKTPTAYTLEYLPTSLQIGGADSLSTCFLGLQVNGYHVDWFKKRQNEDISPAACTSQTRWLTFDSHLIYEGSGFAMYNINRRRFKTFSISFNPRSPGTVCVLNKEHYYILIDAYIDENHMLTVYIKYHSFVSKLITKVTYGTDYTIKLTFTSDVIRKVETTLNGQSDIFKTVEEEKRPLINENNVKDMLYVGGLPEQNSTFVGCVKSVSVNDKDVLLDTFEDALDVNFGTCQTKNCAQFEEGSLPVEMKSLPSVKVIYLVVSRDSVGPVLQLSKNKTKFSLTISVNSDGVSMEETVNDKSEEIYVPNDVQNIVITVLDDAEDESIKVTVNDESEELTYAVSTGWLFKAAKSDDDSATYTYDITIGASTEEDDQFIGKINDFILDGSPLNLLPYIEDNHLAGCQTVPIPKEVMKEKIYPTMACT